MKRQVSKVPFAISFLVSLFIALYYQHSLCKECGSGDRTAC
jgi:hypothetical protein